jgi:hypothetical protein
MSRANVLLSKLKSSLPKPAPPPEPRFQSETIRLPRRARISPAEAHEVSDPEIGSGRTDTERERGKRVPLCFSVYESDVQRLDEIKDFMRGKGYRNVTNSEAVRLACRAVEIGDHFVSVYEQMRRDDGRRR